MQLQPGDYVIINRGGYLGKTGYIEDIQQEPQFGDKPYATVDLGDEQARVPLNMVTKTREH